MTETPTRTGKCYCGALAYSSAGKSQFKAQCHCRECQYMSGGGPNFFMFVPAEGFSYSKGTPKTFTRPDLETPVTREFCENCGTHILTRRPGLDQLILKVGTLDDATEYAPTVAIHTLDQKPFHTIAKGIPTFDRLPPRPKK